MRRVGSKLIFFLNKFKFMTIHQLLLAGMLILAIRAIRKIEVIGNVTLGYYYIEAYVGTPPQKTSLIFDTGSRQTIFPCDTCADCGVHMNGLFNTSKSSTFQYALKNYPYFGWSCKQADLSRRCNFDSAYAEGSQYAGLIGIDNFVFENELGSDDQVDKRHLFGCANTETGEFFDQKVDGIIGFGQYGKRSFHEPPTLLEIESKEKRLENKIFSICLGGNGGQLTLGDWNYDRHLNGTVRQFIDCSSKNWDEQYYIGLFGINVG
jgi:hypothetical protein